MSAPATVLRPAVKDALAYAAQGIRVFPCNPENKQPLTKNGFKAAATDPEQIEAWWRRYPDALIGAATGDGFFVIDLDRKGGRDGVAAFEVLSQIFDLPPTRRISTPSGGVHLHFRTVQRVRCSASKVIAGIDVRGDGGYVILAGSVMADGRRYRLLDATEIAEAPAWICELARGRNRDLYQAVVDAALAPEGTRNDALYKAACRIGRLVAGGALDEVTGRQVLTAAAEHAGLEPGEIESTIRSGFQAGAQDPAPIPDSGLLEELNEEYCVVDVAGKPCVVSFRTDDLGRRLPTYYTFAAFRDLFCHRKIRRQTVGEWWLRHPGRRQYKGITFQPGAKGRVENVPQTLNLWLGFGVEARPGDWSLMRDQHIPEVLAAGNAQHAAYIMKYLAWAVQNPGKRAETVIVFKSDAEGAGKGALGNAMVRIFGQHGRRIDRHSLLTGRFNAHLQDLSFLFADEAFWPGDRSAEGVLKGLITEPTFMIEPKGVNAFDVKNCLHIIMASNNNWTVPAGPSARRFAVFRVSDHCVGDKPYFRALFEQLESGGYEAMLYDLLQLDLQDWHPRDDVPKTDELLTEKINSLRAEHKWWFDVLARGQLPTYPPLSPNQCVCRYLYEDYVTHAGKTGERHRSIEVQLGQFLAKIIPGGPYRAKLTYRERGEDLRGTVYTFPPLSECRAAFEKALQQKYPWSEPHSWLERSEIDPGNDDIF